MFANHAEIGAGAFFRRVDALLEIDNLSIQSGVALTQGVVKGALFSDGCAQIESFSITVVGEPELSLKTKPGNPEKYQ